MAAFSGWCPPVQTSLRRTRVLAMGLLMLGAPSLFAAEAPPVADLSLDVYATAGERVDLGGGRHLNLRCSGNGAPTVILEIGQGMTSMSWRKVQPLLAAHTRVCSYDRAGIGFSDAGPMPRTAQAAADDLHALLRAASIGTPVVLVGHSLGGNIVRLFAGAHPAEVAGLVLVDPVVPDLDTHAPKVAAREARLVAENNAGTRHCLDLAQRGTLANATTAEGCVHPAYPGFSDKLNASIHARDLNPAFWQAALSERESVPANSAALRSPPALGAIPLIVLGADGTNDYLPPAARKTADAAYRAGHQRIVATSSRGAFVAVAHSSHDVQEDRPDAIVDAVTRIIQQAASPVPRR
jgi:pimeloyl-ACP methyl ester carboxylesterase